MPFYLQHLSGSSDVDQFLEREKCEEYILSCHYSATLWRKSASTSEILLRSLQTLTALDTVCSGTAVSPLEEEEEEGTRL